jgi:hypothetical protein
MTADKLTISDEVLSDFVSQNLKMYGVDGIDWLIESIDEIQATEKEAVKAKLRNRAGITKVPE